MLYVPPGFAHDGVAVGNDCMTYSIGFRAPARSELISGFCDEMVAEMAEDDRYGDAGLSAQSNPGEIDTAALTALHAMVTEKLADRAAFARWFGEYNSTPKYSDVDWAPEELVSTAELAQAIADGATLIRNPASRFAFVRQGASGVVLFVDGESFDCAGDLVDLAEQLCAADSIAVDPALVRSDVAMTLLEQLFNHGALAFDIDA
jgi:50S ribosomal protein L16 3-hydroxylase